MSENTTLDPQTEKELASTKKVPVAVARGDGIGPEIMQATLDILNAAGAELEIEEIEIGEKVYLTGNTSGIGKEAWDSIRNSKVFLKAPITTPQGGGYKSLNVTMRKMLGLFANVRPCKSYHPFIATKHPNMDVVIIRENEEDLYAGIEHQQTDEVVQCLKLVSRPGCEKIIRYAFEYARQYERKKVTCFSKDNIMKATDGLFHTVFNEIAAEYPDIENEHWIIDIGTALLAEQPERFDVIVTLNLYGDVISDVAAQITGSVGIAGSSNIGREVAMFEAIHGSAPDIAGKGIANPSGLLQGAIMMLNHIGQEDVAARVANAWMKTIEDGIHTGDIYKEGVSKQKVGTSEFARAVIERLGQEPASFPKAHFNHVPPNMEKYNYTRKPAAKKELLGVDVFVDWKGEDPDNIGTIASSANGEGLELSMITNRGIKVWPDGFDETFCTDHWRMRYKNQNGEVITDKAMITRLMDRVEKAGLDVIKTENLYQFDGRQAFSLGQGQ
jgi:isocitrate dehydrogenase